VNPREKYEAWIRQGGDASFYDLAHIIEEMTIEERANEIRLIEEILLYDSAVVIGYMEEPVLAQDVPELAELYLQYGKDKIDLDVEFKLAAEIHNVAVMKLLYKHGCGIDGVGTMAESALHLAARTSDHDMSKILIDVFGLDPYLKNKEGRTPFDIAMDMALIESARQGDLARVSELVADGYPTQAQKNECRGIGVYAEKSDEYDFMLTLDRPKNRQGEQNIPAWLEALNNGHDEVFKFLVDVTGVNDYCRSDQCGAVTSPLSATIQSGRIVLSTYLLEQGSEMHSSADEFHLAASLSDPALTAVMISMGADVNRAPVMKGFYDLEPQIHERDDGELYSGHSQKYGEIGTGISPLHVAGSAAQVNLLVEHGANVNFACKCPPRNLDEKFSVCGNIYVVEGGTPLHLARSPDVAMALLENGADPLKQNDHLYAANLISPNKEVVEAIDNFIQRETIRRELVDISSQKGEVQDLRPIRRRM